MSKTIKRLEGKGIVLGTSKKIVTKLEDLTEDELKNLKDLHAYVPGWRAMRCLVKVDANNDGQISGEEIDTLVDYLLAKGFGNI